MTRSAASGSSSPCREAQGTRLAVIGAGPVGLEAALRGVDRGYEVTVLEAGRVGESLRRWGPTRFFSPFGMNASPRLRRELADPPPEEALLTGPQMAEQVLEPVAQRLGDRVRTGHRVVAVGRARLTRRDLPGHPLRGERPFRLLLEASGSEVELEAEVVLDASGVYDVPAAMGAGGVPAPGERGLGARFIRHLGELHARLPGLSGREVLLVGHGHSAATALAAMAGLAEPPRVTWAVRTPNRRPCVEVADDPLPERRRIVEAANALAAAPPAWLRVERRTHVASVADGDGTFQVTLTAGPGGRYDAVVSLTGYRPDLSPFSELALDIAPSTEGAAGLSRALARVTDCLSVPAVRPDDLRSGEPGFFLVGAKSYGRRPTFLLQSGLAQLDTVFGLLA
jgi:cation diffusion facilitator CzcD-associated flavoprotein CzcO